MRLLFDENKGTAGEGADGRVVGCGSFEGTSGGEEGHDDSSGAGVQLQQQPSLPSSLGKRRRLGEDEFVRFATVYFDTMGTDAADFTCADGAGGAAGLCGPPIAVTRASQWAHFEALAGAKGYVSLEDLVATEQVDWLRQPMNEGDACGNTAEHMNGAPAEVRGNGNGRLALLSHAFAIVDSDGDGRVVFDDMEGYLGPAL
ncbi:hypothetical protein DQ04_11451000 [Trypanosoma grayi]|uniref:hypothetical protein n=1 Tax=Trypanosoma grayi TaxID=71804 RepID=UPI0004F49055|nr:hypothetical protein DQ04_11451000 [Trypanosoma grayi]KEG06965.1 hypothetical protein DQ04_11451000 [Trypanosoma grayi]